MGATSFFYPIVSRVAAVVLLVAGGLKAQELLAGTVESWVTIFSTAFELLFGFWLLIGLYPRWTRLIALACFLVFLNVALMGALQGRASCGCFGKVSVRPWSAVMLDALLFIGLLLSPASPLMLQTRQIMRWFAFAISAFLVLLALGWPLLGKIGAEEKHIPTIASEDVPPGIDAAALEQLIQGLERNHAALHTLVYTTEKVITQYPVKWTGTRPVRDGNKVTKVTGTWIEPKEKKVSRHACKTWIRGDEVRQDSLSHSDGYPGGDILLISKGKRIQYAPEIRQAWISTAEFADEGYNESIDLRCAGFRPPLKSIADWLKNRCEILNVGVAKDRAGREVIRLRAHTKMQGNAGYEVTADFVPAMNGMPARVVHSFLPDGGVLSVADIDYQQVGPSGAWFPQRIAERSFPRHTTSDPDAKTGQNLSAEVTVKVLAFGQGVQDDDFDPIIPAKTLLMGDLRSGTMTGASPVRASKVTRAQPLPVSAAAPVQQIQQDRAVSTPSWSFAAGMDVLLLGFCLAFRKRLAF